jgi:hypothetical protein
MAKPTNKCFNCNKLKHFSFSCPELKRSNLHKIEEESHKPFIKEESTTESGNEEP